MKRELVGFLQEPGGKTKDDDQQFVGIANLTPSLQHQHLSPNTAVDCGLVVSGAAQEPAEDTRHKPVFNQDDGAVDAKTAEHERRSAAARKAWITIRSNKAAAKKQRTPGPRVGSEKKANSKRKPPGVRAKKRGTRLKRGAAVQVMVYPRPRTKAVLVEASRKAGQSLSSFLVCSGLEKSSVLLECNLERLIPRDEWEQYV